MISVGAHAPFYRRQALLQTLFDLSLLLLHDTRPTHPQRSQRSQAQVRCCGIFGLKCMAEAIEGFVESVFIRYIEGQVQVSSGLVGYSVKLGLDALVPLLGI